MCVTTKIFIVRYPLDVDDDAHIYGKINSLHLDAVEHTTGVVDEHNIEVDLFSINMVDKPYIYGKINPYPIGVIKTLIYIARLIRTLLV